jgi:hypothetical protein
MKRLLIVGAAGAGVALCAWRSGCCSSFDFEKMIERMPGHAPPKRRFRSRRVHKPRHRRTARVIGGIHENRERIFELLKTEHKPRVRKRVGTAA